jgi:hypothetical protein
VALLSLDPSKPQVGNLAAWFLSFHSKAPGTEAPMLPLPGDKVFGFNSYNAEITAALPGGLSGGSFSITIEGMTDDDYKAIQQANEEKPFARLYLGWADTNASLGGYLASAIGISAAVAGAQPPPEELLIAVLHVDSVTRKSGARRYETIIGARDWIYVRAARSWTTTEAVTGATRDEALKKLLEGTAGLRSSDYTFHGVTPNPAASPPPPPSPAPPVELPGEARVREILEEQAKAMAAESASYGRGMILLRDGVLHLGTRPIPLIKGDPKKLTLANGLVEAEALPPTEPNPDPAPGEKEAARQFKLTLKGRPDLKPGDVVEFDAPPEDVKSTQAGVLGGFGGPLIPNLDQFTNAVLLYVDSVQHRLGRTTGFVTTLTGVEVTKGKEWDPPPPTPALPDKHPPGANAELDAALAIRGAMQSELQCRAGTDVAEVRSVAVSGTAEPPGQTETLWRGLVPSDGHGYAARRGEIKRPSLSTASAVPYLTPFAFGKCGLVLPRYPGTRVAVIHRDGKSDDPIEAGTLWPSGKGPDQAAAGDWWLSLPSALAANQRTSLPDTETPAEYSDKVTQDLIDADGNRVIEVGELTVRVGRNVLRNAGVRPPRGQDQDAITIEHADGGAMLILKADGTVQIKGTNIELDAGSGQITLTASGGVNVT